jgi:hypothetical protein
MIQPHDRTDVGTAPVICEGRERRKKRPAYEDTMPADGTNTARSPGEEFGTSRFKGSCLRRYRMCP